MPKGRDEMGKDDMKNELDRSQTPQLGADHAANSGLRGEFRIASNVPAEHRIPPDQLPEPLRRKFPEGMPIQSGGAPDAEDDALQQLLKKLIEEGDLERVMQVLAEKAGKEPGKDMEALAEMFGAQRDIFRKRYLELQRFDLTPEQRVELLKIPAQMVGEVAATNDKGEPLPLFDREKMKTKEQMDLMVTLYKIQVEMQLAMAAFGAGLNYEDQTFFRVGQMNPEGSAKHDTPIYKLFQFVSTAAPAEANLDAEQFAQLAAVDRREAFAGTQAQFYLWIRTESKSDQGGKKYKEYVGYVPLSKFMDKIDAPQWSKKLLSQNWADERVVPRPGEEVPLEEWEKPTYIAGHVPAIAELINKVLEEEPLYVPLNEKIVSTNLWHPLMSTRIDRKRLMKEDVRGEVVDNLFSHVFAAFTLLRLFGRDRAWDKTLSGRVIDAFRKGLSPQIYYEQLYGLPPEGRGPIFLLTMYWDIWTEKFDKAFPWHRINYNTEGDSRSLEQVKQQVKAARGIWYEGWDRYDSVADLQRKIIETKTRREGVAASEVWRESLLVLGLATRDTDLVVSRYEQMLKEKKLDPSKRKERVARFKQYVTQLNQTNPYGYEAYRKQVGNNASAANYRRWIAEQATDFVYNSRVAMARPGEMRSFSEMRDAHWTVSEEVVMADADFEGVFYQWGYTKAWVDIQKVKFGKDAFRGNKGAQKVFANMSYDNMDYQKMKDSDPKKWHDYIASAVKTAGSIIKATKVLVARESLKQMFAGEAVGVNKDQAKELVDDYFLSQFKDAFGNMEDTFNYFLRGFKGHVGKELVLCLARLACKLKNDQWHTVMDRVVSVDGAGWQERSLRVEFLIEEDQAVLQRLGLQFQGRGVYQRNGYPVTWQAQSAHIASASPDMVKNGAFETPMKALYGGRILGYDVFSRLLTDIVGDYLFSDQQDILEALNDLKGIVDSEQFHSTMTNGEFNLYQKSRPGLLA